MIQQLNSSYGDIFEDEVLDEIQEVGHYKSIPEGSKMIEIGDYIQYIPLLISGVIKVLREDKKGDELLLYYLEIGDTCSITMTCCLGQQRSQIRAIAETDVVVLLIPIGYMQTWISKYDSWRKFVFGSYNNRINELLLTLDGIAFYQLDKRLMQYLKEKMRVNHSDVIISTHKEIAYDLHTSRTVISRLLKKLEQLGEIELHRNHLKILHS